ncbi:uncharacterized protein LOC126366352 [Pectinophora gossypiella]|uniref:uncharacterized protein LOC126366352 n=1 Tax=Pectinophora gossypiella TaxID=13191 RepID=UPI00214DF906|nr:uncharacterized protein LOC126366352 [Pectinophora gossypiella]
MWSYRRMLRLSWTQKVTNMKVLQRVGISRKLKQTVNKRKVAYLGHILRSERYQLLQLIWMAKIEGRRRRERRRSWLGNIREWTGVTTEEQLFRLASDREEFSKLTANVQ